MLKRVLILFIALTMVLTTACKGDTNNKEIARLQDRIKELEASLEQARQQIKDQEQGLGTVKDYFPLKSKNKWVYAGYGNEFAEYTEEISQSKDNKFQSVISNPGTNMVRVYSLEQDKIRIVYQQGEAYDNKNVLDAQPNIDQTLLQGPVEVGTKWQDNQSSYEITASNMTMKLEGKIYKNIIEIRIVSRDASNRAVIYKYYARGVGMVKMVFADGETRIESVLKEYLAD